MRLSCKHSNQQTMQYADFSGGLNTSVAQEMIAQNELAVCENMDVDTNTGLLKVVDGNKKIMSPPTGKTFSAMMYDTINNVFLVVDSGHTVYKTDMADNAVLTSIGTLTGALYPVGTAWESGVIIASGGQLQYYNGSALTTLVNSPKQSSFVYTREGRILTNDLTSGRESNIYWSSVGDEETWADSSGDDSTGKWLEVGYKDGGKITAFVPMAQDILVIKDNNCVYRVSGSYPNWSVSEVSRNCHCMGRLAWYSDGINAYVMGRNQIQILQGGAYYGDIKSADVGVKVESKLSSVDTPRMIYIKSLNQVWIPLKERYTLVYDCTVHAFYQRRWNTAGIVDAMSVENDVYVMRPASVCKVAKHYGYDDGSKMRWRFVAKRNVSMHESLLKRAEVNIMPFFTQLIEGNFKIGGVMLELPEPMRAFLIYGNKSRIYHNRQHILGKDQRLYNLYDTGEEIYENFDPIYNNHELIYHAAAISRGIRCLYRNKTITISGAGEGCCFTLNDINFDIAEV